MAAENKCREDLILRCEQNKVDNVPGLARNKTRPTLFGESGGTSVRRLRSDRQGHARVYGVQLPDGIEVVDLLSARGGQGTAGANTADASA